MLRFTREVADQREHRARVAHRLTLDPAAQSFGAYRSEPSAAMLPPRFELTPFYDRWQPSGRLRDQLHLEGIDPRGVMYLGLQRRLRLPPRGTGRCLAALALELEVARTKPASADHSSRRAPDPPRAEAERPLHEVPGPRA